MGELAYTCEMRRIVLLAALATIAGCHSPIASNVKNDVAPGALAPGWGQYIDEPGGYSFQAPDDFRNAPEIVEKTLAAYPGTVGSGGFSKSMISPSGGRVLFILARLDNSKIRLNNMDDIATKFADQGKASGFLQPGDKHERIQLPIGPAEVFHVDRTGQSGTRVKMDMYVFASPTRLYIAVTGYPYQFESQAAGTLKQMVDSIRIFVPKKDGTVKLLPFEIFQPEPPENRTPVTPPAPSTSPPSEPPPDPQPQPIPTDPGMPIDPNLPPSQPGNIPGEPGSPPIERGGNPPGGESSSSNGA